MRRPRNRRNGFVLLVTLVTLAIAGLLLASLANRSLTLAMQAETEAADAQLHWGAVSIRQATAKILAASPEREATSVFRESWRLNDVTFQLVIENENTKLNLNRLLPTHGVDSLKKVVRNLTSAEVDLHPSKDISETAFQSWGQVFSFEDRPEGQLTIDWLRDRARHLRTVGTISGGKNPFFW
ncbi:type II secretion system protein [Planctomycetota bacterium]